MTTKNILMASMFLSSLHICADDGKAMVLKSTNEATQSYAVSNISSVKYEDGVMILTLKNGNVQKLNVEDIKSMTFDSVATAIETLNADGGAIAFSVYDESGKEVASGMTGEDGKVDMPVNLRGVYVIKVGNVTKKIVVK